MSGYKGWQKDLYAYKVNTWAWNSNKSQATYVSSLDYISVHTSCYVSPCIWKWVLNCPIQHVCTMFQYSYCVYCVTIYFLLTCLVIQHCLGSYSTLAFLIGRIEINWFSSSLHLLLSTWWHSSQKKLSLKTRTFVIGSLVRSEDCCVENLESDNSDSYTSYNNKYVHLPWLSVWRWLFLYFAYMKLL